ncbi:MAG: ABC transporter permease [Candidatus Acidiferrales bacterium]
MLHRLRRLFRKSRAENELDRELRFHIEKQIADNIAAGVPATEARRRARLEFGGIEGVKEEVRDTRWETYFDNLFRDFGFAFRTLRKDRRFSLIAILAMALGIGANTAIFSVVNAVLLRPLPFDQPDRLVQLWHTPPQAAFPGIPIFTVSPANFLDWRAESRAFDDMAAYGFGRYTLTANGQTEPIRMVAVTRGFFSILHAQPALGRVFLNSEDEPGREHEVVLSSSMWRSHWGADPQIIGKNIELNEQAFTVIGVMGAGFEFPIPTDPNDSPQMWKPLAWTDGDRAVRDNHNYAVVARLKPGNTLQQAQADMDSVSNRLAVEYPKEDKGWGAIAIPLRENLVGDVRPALLILLGAVACLLLIACANVANLVLAKTISRRKEVAIRTALGASRRRLLQQFLSETLLLALTGGALGLIFAHYGVALMVKYLAQRIPRSSEITVDGWVLAFTLGVSLLSGIAAGVLPALRLARQDANQALKEGLGRTSSDAGGNRTRNGLVISEVALSLMLLIGAGLLIRSLWMLRTSNPGFDPDHVITMTVSVPSAKFPEAAGQIQFFDRILDRARTLPGVQSAGIIDNLPLTYDGSHEPVSVEGRPAVAMADQPEVEVRIISPGYLSAMHIALLSGRGIDDSDVAGRPGAVLVSESMAKSLWPNEDPVGKHLTLYFYPDVTRVVVGVVADIRLHALNETAPAPTLYFPLAQLSAPRGRQWQSFPLNLAVRTSMDPAGAVATVATSVRELDPEVLLLDPRTMDDSVTASLSPERFSVLLLAGFAGLALLLAVVGIYSVMSYSVSRRIHEIGIRMSLGASQSDVLLLVVRQGMLLALAGSAVGIAGALVLSRLMTTLLYGVAPNDPITFAAVSALLVIVALAASYIPARRAMRVEPMVALRHE